MLIETVELNLANTGLGALNEENLMALFANVQAHSLIAQTDRVLSDVVDIDNQPLYPGYVWLNLTVPDMQPIDQFKVWKYVDIGVKVHRFGSTMLESEYVIGPSGTINKNSFTQNDWPRMKALSVFIRSDDMPSAPAINQLAELPSCTQVPTGLKRMKMMEQASNQNSESADLILQQQLKYPVFLGRDVSANKNLMFSQYIMITNVTEQQLLQGNQSQSIFPQSLIPHFHLSDREVMFSGHAAFGTTLTVDTQLSLTTMKEPFKIGEDIILAELSSTSHIYDSNTDKLLTKLVSKKHLRVPKNQYKKHNETMKIWRNKGNNSEK